ncbi:MAG TPA: hypothetical protein VLK84_30975 [Longimicrobium sp.]|nr:hypothetical protein [Longimicrobium sp.]
MAESPSVWGRMFARFQGEVPAETLEAYRRASLPVFERMDQVEARRLACATEGLTPWTIPPATRTEFLCAWNAFVLQTLGNDIVEADYAEYPATAGYVPPVTADQVMAYFSEVEGWLDRANQAQANPDYALDVDVPAQLPPWSEVEPCPESHLRGLVSAMRAVGEHAAAAMAVLPASAPEPAQQRQLNRIRQLYASAQGKARYAAELHGADPPPAVQERVEPYAREAIEMFYELGQLIADPALAGEGAEGEPAPAPGKAPLLPSQPGFDRWMLTEPDARAALKKDKRAREAIERIWRMDPDPLRTGSIFREIQAAMDRGDVGYATTRDGSRVGHWFRCPWGPIYVAKRAVELDGVRLLAGQQFVFEVSAAEAGAAKGKRGKGFTRRILLGTFKATESVVYDEPGRGA